MEGTEKSVQAEQPIHRELRILDERLEKCGQSMHELQNRLETIVSNPQPEETTKTPMPESNSPIESTVMGLQTKVEDITGWINDLIQRLQI